MDMIVKVQIIACNKSYILTLSISVLSYSRILKLLILAY